MEDLSHLSQKGEWRVQGRNLVGDWVICAKTHLGEVSGTQAADTEWVIYVIYIMKSSWVQKNTLFARTCSSKKITLKALKWWSTGKEREWIGVWKESPLVWKKRGLPGVSLENVHELRNIINSVLWT